MLVAALLLGLTPPASGDVGPGGPAASAQESEIASMLHAAEAAWRSGQLVEVHARASDALALIEASDCPVRADAALAAMMAGLSGLDSEHSNPGAPDFPRSYLHWVASTVDSEFEVLPPALRTVADALRSEPGEHIREDWFFLRSPFRNRAPGSSECREAVLDADLFSAAAENGSDQLILVTQWRERDVHRFVPASRAELLFGYPRAEAEALFDKLQSLENPINAAGQIDHQILMPCATYMYEDLSRLELCREGDTP